MQILCVDAASLWESQVQSQAYQWTRLTIDPSPQEGQVYKNASLSEEHGVY